MALLSEPASATLSAVTSQQAILTKQLAELKTLRHDMQAMYDISQQEVVDAREVSSRALSEAVRAREQAASFAAENAALRGWNERLAAELVGLREELFTGTAATEASEELLVNEAADEAEAHPIAAATTAAAAQPTGVAVDVAQLQRAQLEAAAAAARLTHAHAKIKRREKELRTAAHRTAQLQEGATALGAELVAAAGQITELERRIREQGELARQVDQLTAEHEALSGALERTTASLSRAKEENAQLATGPLAAAEQRVNDLEEREWKWRHLLERRVRREVEMAAAVQTLGADSRLRIEETVKLRLLARHHGASAMEIERARQSDVDAADPPFCSGRRGNLAEEASRRAAERIALVPTLEASPPVSEQLISPPAAVRRRPQATACSSLSSAALTVAAIPGYDPRMEVSGGDVSTAFDPALQSHSALQEKLKKVREKFTDIKLQVGYDTQGHAA